jgi:hypothetical protein
VRSGIPPGIPLPFIRRDASWAPGSVGKARRGLLPNLRVLGPRLGPRLRDVRAALERGEVEPLEDGRFRVAGELLETSDVIQGERHELPGWATAEDNGISVAFDVELDDDLRREGRVFDLIHSVNAMRRAAGIELTDRIVLTLPEGGADLLAHRDWIARQVLADEIDLRADLKEPARAAARSGRRRPEVSPSGSRCRCRASPSRSCSGEGARLRVDA